MTVSVVLLLHKHEFTKCTWIRLALRSMNIDFLLRLNKMLTFSFNGNAFGSGGENHLLLNTVVHTYP